MDEFGWIIIIHFQIEWTVQKKWDKKHKIRRTYNNWDNSIHWWKWTKKNYKSKIRWSNIRSDTRNELHWISKIYNKNHCIVTIYEIYGITELLVFHFLFARYNKFRFHFQTISNTKEKRKKLIHKLLRHWEV